MSTSKDGSKKIAKVPKEKSASKTSSSKRESSTDRTDIKKKKESQKTKTKETTSSLIKISEENAKPKKSSTSIKVSTKPEKALSTTSTKVSSKPNKDPATTSTKVSSKQEKVPSTTSTKVSSKQEKVPSTTSTKVSSKQEKVPSTTSTKVSSKQEKVPSTTSTKVSSKQEKVPSTTSKRVTSKSEKISSTTTSKTSSKLTQDITKSTSISKTSSKTSSSNRDVPLTPTGSRIKKSQYFPSKNLYSNALKYTDIPENILEGNTTSVKKEETVLNKSTREDKEKDIPPKANKAGLIDSSRSVRPMKTNIKEPFLAESSPDTGRKSVRSVKVKIKDVAARESSPDTSSMSERPRTATLRKGSIVNANIVGPEAPKHDKKPLVTEHPPVKEQALPIKQKSPSPTNSDDNYDDDFESYESDFETFSSSEENADLAKISGEETSSVSSSSEDIPEKNDLSPTTLQTDNKKVFSAITDDERAHDSGTFELSDFKHKRVLEHVKESVEKENNLQEVKLKEKANLSSLSDEGFEDQQSLQFINFADAQKKCAKRRASEQRKKRGEEILGMIKLDNVNFTIFDSPAVPYDVFISSYGQNNAVQASAQTGDDDVSDEVQTDAIEVQEKWSQMPVKFTSFDQNQEHFWTNYKKEYLGAGDDKLAENASNPIELINEKRLSSFLNQAVDLIVDILAEANIRNLDKINKNERDIPFSDGYLQFNTAGDIFENTRVQNISVFAKNINHILTVHVKNDEPEDFLKSIVSIWDVSDFNAPRTILVSYGEVCCAAFSLDVSEYVFAGQKDGAILVWNIKEKTKIYDIPSRTPTVTTDIGSSHYTKVVSIQPVKYNEEHRGYFDKPESNELCSLDEDGEIIIWNIYTDYESKTSTNDIVLINTATISLQNLYSDMPDLLCSDFILLEKHIYVSTNYGYILHCLLNLNSRNVKKFVPATQTINATCLEACPFSSSFFLAGYLNGNITLFSRNTERHLMVLRNNEEIANTSVQIIQWSKTKPFVLYAKDSRNTVHIWDLSKSDMYPELSIPFNESISCLKLSPVINIEQEDTSYMLIGTEDGKVYLHLLNKEYGQESYEMYNKHVATFLNYVSRL